MLCRLQLDMHMSRTAGHQGQGSPTQLLGPAGLQSASFFSAACPHGSAQHLQLSTVASLASLQDSAHQGRRGVQSAAPHQAHTAPVLSAALPTGEEGAARQQLCQDAAQAPHVDGHLVRQAQDDLRAAVEAALDVCVHTLRLEAAASKVNDLQAMSWH